MKMKIKVIFSFILMSVFSIPSIAEEIDWRFDPYRFQYDMTVYVGLNADGIENVDIENYTIGVFVGNECRGIVEKKTIDGHIYGYLRAKSNSPSGEVMSFKVMRNSNGRLGKCEATLTFADGGLEGMPSSPLMISVTNKYKVTFIVENSLYHEEELFYGDSYSAPVDPSISGATFDGWSPAVPENSTVPTHDVEYVAMFTVISTVEAVFSDPKENVRVYSLSGKYIRTCSSAEEMNNLTEGLYVVKGIVVLVRH